MIKGGIAFSGGAPTLLLSKIFCGGYIYDTELQLHAGILMTTIQATEQECTTLFTDIFFSPGRALRISSRVVSTISTPVVAIHRGGVSIGCANGAVRSRHARRVIASATRAPAAVAIGIDVRVRTALRAHARVAFVAGGSG